ncbi:putative invasin/adhesin protein [Escherichia coli]|uniref:Putative invasin/adhesin protein n=1 Tax=Escherichia coli TaxID=562 RepID=A0A376LP78_ECOLX|nr:putative invasin/adhesin protein [Escherichia coli]
MKKLTLTSSPLIGVNAPKGATLTATLTSANGTPVEGQVINFSVTLEGATLSGGKVRTNSSGQAPVVLTSNKVGTYTVTASFHNGVTIQTQTTVKVTGNPSTAHVASFIADPSTITATNSDLSTLKATVEDGCGNLIEGLTVYFALKSGSTTLTSLTAVDRSKRNRDNKRERSDNGERHCKHSHKRRWNANSRYIASGRPSRRLAVHP